MRAPNTHCSYCGTAFAPPLAYPRTCASCGSTIWANPIPVSVLLVPVRRGERTGLLVVRRGIEPGLGKLALVGGFLEEHETWQAGGAREVREETDVLVDAANARPFWFTSTEPRPNRVLLFGIVDTLEASALSAFSGNKETQSRGLVYGPAGLEEVFAFPLHAQAAKRYFESVGQSGPHSHEEI